MSTFYGSMGRICQAALTERSDVCLPGLSSTITAELKSIASRLSPSQLTFTQVNNSEKVRDTVPGNDMEGGEMDTGLSKRARQLVEQAVVYVLVLAPPLHVASSNPEAFFGWLNVRRINENVGLKCKVSQLEVYAKFGL